MILDAHTARARLLCKPLHANWTVVWDVELKDISFKAT